MAALKLSGNMDLESKLLISSNIFYYTTLVAGIAICLQIYSNVLYLVTLLKAKKNVYQTG